MANSVPLGVKLLPSCPGRNRTFLYKVFIIIFTFFCYTSYHLSRKPISVVKSVLHRNCSKPLDDHSPVDTSHGNDTTWCDWAPFDHGDYKSLFGELDTAYLFAYAAGMFVSGHIAERMNLRYFLSAGMLLSGFFTAAFGFGYFFSIHSIVFYVVVQLVGGFVQATGWPSVVTCMGNWYGKGKRGFIMGVWNAHTSVGNILGALIAGAFVNHAWGWSFVVPGIIIGSLGVIAFFFLVPEPADVDCELPDQTDSKYKDSGPINENTAIITAEEYTPNDREPLLQSAQSLDSFAATTEYGSSDKPMGNEKKEKPISFIGALKIPGVIEFSLCLFFSKLVNYTFLFWLPKYISAKTSYDPEKAADISTIFDVGGIFGGITVGFISDYTGMRATTCVLALVFTGPILYIYNLYGNIDLAHSIGLAFVSGYFVNAPYALITTAVSADLGTHEILQGNAKALSTVTAIIDGTGSIGAAVGPLLAGVIPGWNNVFYMLIGSIFCALLLLMRLFIKEMRSKGLCGGSPKKHVVVVKA